MELRRIHANAIPAALERANRYRLLNEPMEAESICRDILAIDARHQAALKTLILSLTDQFSRQQREPRDEAARLLTQLESEYDREYYSGVVAERAAKALIASGAAASMSFARIQTSMDHFKRAIDLAESGNDEAVLRWNACIRLIERFNLQPETQPEAHRFVPEAFDDEVPGR